MIVQTITDSFIQELLSGVHDFTNDVFYMALYTNNVSLNATTVSYTTTGEVVGVGYVAGGDVLSPTSASMDGVSYVSFEDITWSPAAFTARGALIYNSSKGNRSVAVLNFGGDKTSSNTFTVQMPPATATTALIRIKKGVE